MGAARGRPQRAAVVDRIRPRSRSAWSLATDAIVRSATDEGDAWSDGSTAGSRFQSANPTHTRPITANAATPPPIQSKRGRGLK